MSREKGRITETHLGYTGDKAGLYSAAMKNKDLVALLDLVELQHKAVTGYALTTAGDEWENDYHVCCGTATDLSHTTDCEACVALAAYNDFNKENQK